jgi:cysteine-rich repeat protein
MLTPAWADQNPPTCTDSGPALFIRTLRDTNNDGIPDTSFSGSVREGEVIGYVCRLIYDDLPQCGYEGGQLTFDAPATGTNFVDVTGGTIPLLCDAPECDPAGVGQYLSTRTDYTVNHSDANAACANPTDIRGVCRYQNGTSHRDADEEFPISAETPACTPVRFCGDSILQTSDGEACDPPGSPAGNNGQNCRADCTVCGDGRQDAGEACDDGNGVDTDGCRNNCTLPACGDGIRNQTCETCDGASFPSNAPSSHGACRTGACGDPGCTFCGDAVRNGDEQCDDGNNIDTDGCRNDCYAADVRRRDQEPNLRDVRRKLLPVQRPFLSRRVPHRRLRRPRLHVLRRRRQKRRRAVR